MRAKSNSWMRFLCLYASLCFPMGTICFYAKHDLIVQGTWHPYREGSQLPSSVVHPGGHCYLPRGESVLPVVPLRRQNGFVLKHLRITWSPLQLLSWAVWLGLENSGAQKGWTKVFVSSSLWSKRGSKGHPSSIVLFFQGNCDVKKERGPSSGTSGTFIFNPSWKHRGLQTSRWPFKQESKGSKRKGTSMKYTPKAESTVRREVKCDLG